MISAVILAAGLSRRMGRPKLLLPLGGQAIIEHVVDHMEASRAGEIIIVTGADARALQSILSGRPVRWIHNPRYEEGMGTSVATGASVVSPAARGILFINGDQPLVPATLIDQLIEAAPRTEAMIIRHRAKSPPVIFHRALREELCRLDGDVGGRQLMQKYWRQTLVIPHDPGSLVMDVDTEPDYERLKKLWLRLQPPGSR